MYLNYRASAADEIPEIAGKYSVALLYPDNPEAAKRLRAADPNVKIYAYMDLSSVRSDDADQGLVSPSYQQAASQGWLAQDVNGNDIEWRPYPGHWQAKVWDPAYQQAWITRAREIIDSGFDGILADNAMWSLSYYNDAHLSGTSSKEETDAKIRAGLQSLVNAAGPAVNDAGGVLVPNITGGRLSPQTWSSLSAHGGGLEENFMLWSDGNSTQPDIWDFPDGGWSDQASLMAKGPSSLAMTTITDGDHRSAVYGFASFLMYADPGDAWMPVRTDDSMTTIPEQFFELGAPQGAATQANGVVTRTFAGGWAAVNPTRKPLTVTAPDGFVDANGQPIGTVTLQEMSGVVGKRG